MTSTPINRFRPFNIHLLVFLLVMVSLFFLFIDPLPSQATQSLQERPNKEAVLKKMAGICVPFVENRGQVGDERVRYYARTFGGSLFVMESGEMVYSLPYKEKSESNNRDASRRKGEQKGEAKNTPTKGVSLKETLVGATINLVQGEEMSSSKVSYFRGNDQSRWQKGLSTYETVSRGEVYPGIDLKLKSYGNNAEKLFTVRPSRDPNLIRMNIEGAKAISITTTGELEITTDLGPVRFTKPVAFQEIDGKRIDVPVQYALTEGTTTYGFTVASYDNTRDLAIDPLLQSTYLGGSKADLAYAITLDSAGNVYVAGETSWDSSYNLFPGTTGGARPSYGGGTYDVFVAKLNSSLTSLL
ncbi:MAG: SBBP repeat-containing protein, partial [Deltaproteobacteria bacterium]|nr:SBBP repeat-containing protein [Deltaproteobacteria bacterium]